VNHAVSLCRIQCFLTLAPGTSHSFPATPMPKVSLPIQSLDQLLPITNVEEPFFDAARLNLRRLYFQR
jgi:hypothetical protein